mgnify:CR=1 FL=1
MVDLNAFEGLLLTFFLVGIALLAQSILFMVFVFIFFLDQLLLVSQNEFPSLMMVPGIRGYFSLLGLQVVICKRYRLDLRKVRVLPVSLVPGDTLHNQL